MFMSVKSQKMSLILKVWLGSVALCAFASGCHSAPKSSSNPVATGSTSGSGSTGGSTGSQSSTGNNPRDTVPPSNGPSALGQNSPVQPEHTPVIPIIPYKKGPLKNLAISAKGTNGWVPCHKSADQLAQEADRSMKILDNAAYDGVISLNIEKGRGVTQVHGAIEDGHKFHAQYETWAGDHPAVVLVVSDGVNRYTDRDKKLGVGDKMATREVLHSQSPGSGAQLLRDWLTDMPAYVTGWYRFQANVYQPLIQELQNPANQFKVVAEKRVTPYQGQLVTDYRILATRSPSSQLGYAELEIILDGDRFLPVTVRSRYRFPGKGPNEMMWSAHWFPKMNPPSLFEVPVVPAKKP